MYHVRRVPRLTARSGCTASYKSEPLVQTLQVTYLANYQVIQQGKDPLVQSPIYQTCGFMPPPVNGDNHRGLREHLSKFRADLERFEVSRAPRANSQPQETQVRKPPKDVRVWSGQTLLVFWWVLAIRPKVLSKFSKPDTLKEPLVQTLDRENWEGWWSVWLLTIEQILRTRDESQWIVTARSLCHLQYPVRTKSSAKDLPQWRMKLSCLAPEPNLWLSPGEPTDMLLHSEKPNVLLVGWHHWEKWPRT